MDKSYLINSMVGASIAEIITLPLCTIKTNHQVDYLKTRYIAGEYDFKVQLKK